MDTNDDAVAGKDAPILIVGGSLVGLTLAALLAKYGIKSLVIEKHSSTAIHPRATVMMPRTMQIFKELGLYETMLQESLKYYDNTACAVTVESLAGRLLNTWMADVNEVHQHGAIASRERLTVAQGIENVSATRRVFLTQQALEPLLRAKAKELGAELRFSTEMVDFQQDGSGIKTTVRDCETGFLSQVRTQYMIACDGFRSSTRSKLGIATRGPGLLSRALTIYFEILDKDKLAKLANAHLSGVIYVANEVVRCFFRFDRTKQESFLVINSAGKQGSEESRFPADSATEEKAADYLRAAIGDPTIPFKIHQLSTWDAVADVPERLRDARIFLAGDAAHRMPPSGGFGGNTGVQDAHNLAWKLALVLKGQASQTLLDTYEEERLPIAKHTVWNATAHYVHRTEPSLGPLLEEFDIQESPVEHLELAYKYRSKAICIPEPWTALDMTEDPASAVAAPGSVAHHVLVRSAEGNCELPISRFFGKSLVLFDGQGDGRWRSALGKLRSADANLPEIRTVTLDFDDQSAFAQRYNIRTSGAVLVRPDGFVAWSRNGCEDGTCESLLADALRRILCTSASVE